MCGECAVVHPVRTGDGEPAVLKLEWPHPEAEHEHLALSRWGGNGAVRLLRADPNRFAFLLERAEARHDLNALPALEACEVAARLYPLLHIPAPPHLRALSEQATRWSRQLLALPVDAPLPRRYVERAAALAGDLAADPQCDGTLIHTDLHYDNVLRSARGAGVEWLAIDPSRCPATRTSRLPRCCGTAGTSWCPEVTCVGPSGPASTRWWTCPASTRTGRPHGSSSGSWSTQCGC